MIRPRPIFIAAETRASLLKGHCPRKAQLSPSASPAEAAGHLGEAQGVMSLDRKWGHDLRHPSWSSHFLLLGHGGGVQ